MATIGEFRKLAGDLDRCLAEVARRPDVAREVSYYLAHIRSVKSITDFLDDTRLYQFALKAFDLHDMGLGTAFVGAVLTAGSGQGGAFGLELSAPGLREFVSAFDFARHRSAVTAPASVMQPVVERYLRVEFEAAAGVADESLGLAFYFLRRAPVVAGLYGLMADPRLYAVVRTALALPAAPAPAEVAEQARRNGLAWRADGHMDGGAVQEIIALFLARWRGSGSPSAAAPPLAAGDRSAPLMMLSLQAIASIQELKPAGGQ